METVRLALIRSVKKLFDNVTDEENPSEDKTYYGVKFSVVGIGALGDGDNRKKYAIGIVVGEERKPSTYPTKDPLLELNIEFRQTINAGDEDPGIASEVLLGVVQQVVADNETIGGLAISWLEVGNEIDLVTYSDKSVRGVVRTQVQYRHAFNSVYDTVPTV
jgi:hypothetical protein